MTSVVRWCGAGRTMALMNTEVTDELLSTTRAVRRRLDLERPVDHDVLLQCLRLAVQAPTGSNRQGWRWLVVTDDDKKRRLAELYREGGEAYLRRSAEAAEGDQQRRVYGSAIYLLENLHRVPVMVIPCIQGRPPEGNAAGFYGSIFPAVWSFQLALRSRGLGLALTTLHLRREAEAARLLAVPGDVTQVGLLPVAYTKGTDFRPADRGPVEEITYWDAWSQQ